jgi:hypothetical protein
MPLGASSSSSFPNSRCIESSICGGPVAYRRSPRPGSHRTLKTRVVLAPSLLVRVPSSAAPWAVSQTETGPRWPVSAQEGAPLLLAQVVEILRLGGFQEIRRILVRAAGAQGLQEAVFRCPSLQIGR